MKLSYLFLGWYTIGLTLMLFYKVPHYLQFSNGLFLLFYALCLMEMLLVISNERKVLLMKVMMISIIAFFIEVFGVHTGFPFGSYRYYSTLGPPLWGVPITIALAWAGVIINSMLISSQTSKSIRAIETAFWVVMLDLILDPAAVNRKFWIWKDKGSWYSIPTANFVSWGLIAAILSVFFPLFQQKQRINPWAFRIYQAMVMMFGLLAWKAGITGLLFLALGSVLLIEGRYRYDSRRKKQEL